MDDNNPTFVDPGEDSENENFVVIEVSDEEFNSAIESSCEDSINGVLLNKNNLNINTKKRDFSDEHDDDDDTSEESGIHSEVTNLFVKEEPIVFRRDDAENENVETGTFLNNDLICVENGNKIEKDDESSSNSSLAGDSLSSEPEEAADGDGDSNEDSDQYETSSSGDDSDELSSDSDSDDSDDVSSDSDDSENGVENLSDDSDEAVVSDSDNSDDSSEFSAGEGDSDNGNPKNMEDDEHSDQDEIVEHEGSLSEGEKSSKDYDDVQKMELSSEETIDSPGDSINSEGEKSPGGENVEEEYQGEAGESISSPMEHPGSEEQESFPNSPRSEDEKSNSTGSPNSEKSYQSVLSDEAGSPNSKISSDNDSPRSIQSEGSPKSGSSSGSGSPDSKTSQDEQETLSLPSSPHSGSDSGSNNSGSPNSCDPGSPSPPESLNSPRTPHSDDSNSQHSFADSKSPESRSNSDEENTLKESDGNSASPGSMSPQSSCGSKSPSDGSGSPRSIGSPSQSDENNSPKSFGSPEEYSLSPGSNYEEENVTGSPNPESPFSPSEKSPPEFDENSENGNKSEYRADLAEIDDENSNLMGEENEDLIEADDEDSQGDSDDSGGSEQWTDIESENEENNSDIDMEVDSDDSDDKDSGDGFSSDSWDSYDSEDSCDSEDYEATLNEIEGKEKLTGISTAEECISGSLNIGNFEEEGKILLADDDSDNWEDVESSSEEGSSENDSESDSEEDSNDDSPKKCKILGVANVLNAQEEIQDDLDNEEDEDDDWEIIDDNNNITEEENSLSDSDSTSDDSDDSEEEEKIRNKKEYNLFDDEQEMVNSNSTDNFLGENSVAGMENLIDTAQLMKIMTAIKTENCSVQEFSKMKMKEYLKTSGFINENLNEKSEKTMDAKDLAELISKQDNNLNSVSLGPDYEPEEIKNEISRFWGFYHSLKKSDPDLGVELTPLLVPMLIYFYVELITSALPPLAIELFSLFGDKFIKEGGDAGFIKELTTLSEIKNQADFEKNENLQSFQDRKYTFSLSITTFEKLTKFLAKSRTPVLISLFSDRFVTKLKFPDVQKSKIEEFENEVENACDENGDENSDSEDLCFGDLEEENIKRLSRAREVIKKLRSNPLMDLPSVTVYTSNGRPVCGAMSSHGTMVAYGMNPAGIRLCKTSKAQHFSDEDKENENQNQSSVVTLNAHEGTVYDVAFHPKTKLLFSVGYDGFMRAWDLHKDKPANRCVYSGHLGAIWTMDIAPSGRMIATGGMDTTARLWLPERNDYVRLFVGHYFDVDCVKFHPNEAYLATGSIDKSVRLWSINDGNMVRILTGCPGRVNALAFHESGKYIAGGGEDDIIRIWDIAEGDLLYELPSEMCCKDLSFHGSKLAGCFDKSIVQIWDLKKLIGGEDINTSVKKEETEDEKFYNIFGDAKSSNKEEKEILNGDIIIPAPYSISCTTDYVFKVNFKDSANVFCLGAERKPIFVRQTVISDDKSSGVKSSAANSSEERVFSSSPDEESLPFSLPTFHEYPFLDSDHRATIESLDEESVGVDSLDYSGGYSTEAPNAVSTDDIDTTERDKIRTEVETYDNLIKSAVQDDDTWLTDL